MARAAARSGPSTRMLEKGRNEFTDDFFLIAAECCEKRAGEQGGGRKRAAHLGLFARLDVFILPAWHPLWFGRAW